jgi:formate dehydrogenase maturation protein FdhE
VELKKIWQTRMARRGARKKTHRPLCPECGSKTVLPIVYDLVNAAAKRALRGGEIILADRHDWEGLPQWHCKECGCEWRGRWRSFKLRAV